MAQVGGLVVGEATYRSTKHVIHYRDSAPVTVKGKAEPIPIWIAIGAQSQHAVEIGRAPAPFIGRRDESLCT